MTFDEFLRPSIKSPIYHYTDARGLIGMVEDHALWATESSGMNDPREGLYGLDRIRAYEPPEEHRLDFEWHRRRLDALVDHEVYVACCTTQSDDVSQWTRYTSWPDLGYSVGLDPTVRLGVVRTDTPRPWSLKLAALIDFVQTNQWSTVVYGPRAFDALMEQFLPWADNLVTTVSEADDYDDSADRDHVLQQTEDSVTTALSYLGRLAKDEGFVAENEVRTVVSMMRSGKYVKYRPSRYGVVRYAELAAGPSIRGFIVRDKDPKTMNKALWTRLPIVSVTIGPSPFAERGVVAVQRLLEDNGYEDVPVHLSESQVR